MAKAGEGFEIGRGAQAILIEHLIALGARRPQHCPSDQHEQPGAAYRHLAFQEKVDDFGIHHLRPFYQQKMARVFE